MPIDLAPLAEFLHRSSEPLLMTHIRPDADGLGSQLALAEALRQLGKRPRVVIASKLLPRYRFLDPDRTVIEDFTPPGEQFATCDAILIMDTGTWNQIGEFGPYLQAQSVPKAVLDHHRTQDDLGGTAYVDTSAEATGRMTYDLIQALGVPLSDSAAQHLFMALAHDTGWFRHSNTTSATFDLAEKLVAAGAQPTPIYEQMFECATLPRLRLLGTALSKMTVVEDGLVAYTEIALRDYHDTGAVPGDTEELINYPRTIEGVEVAMVFIEQPTGGVKVSFRSRSRVDVSRLAERFQGGGHMRASGCKIDGTLETARAQILAAVREALQV